MQRFYHNDREKLLSSIAEFNRAANSFNASELNVLSVFEALLQSVISMYHNLGLSHRESRIQACATEFSMALQGINPATLARQTTNRREMVKTFIGKNLQQVEGILQEDLQATDEKINTASLLMGQIVVAAVQQAIIKDSDLAGAITQSAAEKLWSTMKTDPNLALGQKRLALQVSPPDVLLLFMAQLESLKNAL